MCRTISDTYVQDVNKKVSRLVDNDPKFATLTVGEKCLVYFPITSESSKLYSQWKGLYEIAEVLDHNTYIVCEVGSKRKRYAVQSNRVRPLKTEFDEDSLLHLEKGKDDNNKSDSNSKPAEASRIQPTRRAKENICYDES